MRIVCSYVYSWRVIDWSTLGLVRKIVGSLGAARNKIGVLDVMVMEGYPVVGVTSILEANLQAGIR
jgi:hypothetical protein